MVESKDRIVDGGEQVNGLQLQRVINMNCIEL